MATKGQIKIKKTVIYNLKKYGKLRNKNTKIDPYNKFLKISYRSSSIIFNSSTNDKKTIRIAILKNKLWLNSKA